MAHIKSTPQDFIKRTLVNTATYTVFIGFLVLFFARKVLFDIGVKSQFLPILIVLAVLPIICMYVFILLLKAPRVIIKRRRKDIDKDVLFAGRYLLVKLNSGKPLLNSLIDASKTYGVGSKYFKEIVDNITLGMPIEEAIDRAMEMSPSPFFQKILYQINNSIKIGVDVTETLKEVLDEIVSDQMIEIESYSNKLNSVALFYMILATVVPSLGLSIFVVVAVMVGFQINLSLYVVLWMVVVLLQFMFINIFKAIRPNINF